MPLYHTRFRDIAERETKAFNALKFEAEQQIKKAKEAAPALNQKLPPGARSRGAHQIRK